MKTIYLIRHAESEYNLFFNQGQRLNKKDPNLTTTGIIQAQRLGD